MVIASLLAVSAFASTAAPSVSITDLVECADISGVAVSPDGRRVAFRTARPSILDNRIHLEWYVAPLDGRAPARAIADGGGPDINSGIVVSQMPVWAPSSKTFYFRAEFEGAVQIWRAPVDGSRVRQVTSEDADVRSMTLEGGKHALSFTVGATRGAVERAEENARKEGVLIDGTVDVVSRLTGNGMVDGHPATERFNENWFAHEPLLWTAPTLSKELPLEPRDIQTSATARPTIAARIDNQGSAQRLHAITAEGVDRACDRPFCPTGHIRTAVGLGDSGDILVTTSGIDHNHTLSVWSPGKDRWRTLWSRHGLIDGGDIIYDTPCGIGPRAIACVEAEASVPPRLVGIDMQTGRSWPIFDPNASLRHRAWPVTPVQWTTSTGMAVSGQLLLPRSPKPRSGYPLVVIYYSCEGFLKGGTGDELPLAPLAKAGIATLCINRVRNDGSVESDFERTAIDAIAKGIDTLATHGTVDRSRVGIAGLSLGSQVAFAVLEHTSLMRAAAISSAQIEPYYYWVNQLPGRDIHAYVKSFFGMGDPDTDPDSWKQHSAVGQVEAIKAPVLFQLPESEMRLSMELYARLKRSPTPTEMIAYPNETHVKWEPAHKQAVYERNLDWFRFWLLGQQDPDPAKAEQYERWRAFSARPGYALPIEHHPAP